MVAGAIAVLLAGGFAAPMSATASSVEQGEAAVVVQADGGPTNPSATVTQGTATMLDSIAASWGAFMEPGKGGFAVADDTTILHVTLPTQFSDHFGEQWEYRVRTRDAAQTLVSGQVPDAHASFFVPLPKALLGYTQVELLVTNGPLNGSVPLPISLSAILTVHPELSTTSAALPLTKATATSWGRSTMVGSSPTEVPVAPGYTVTIASPQGTWTIGPDPEWYPTGQITAFLMGTDGSGFFGTTPAVASTDGSTVTVRIPQSTFTPYFPEGATSRALTIQIGMTAPIGSSQRGSFGVQAYVTLVPAVVPAVDRVEGEDRYAVAVEVSKQAFPNGAETAFVVTGANYPDALSAGPAAVHRDAPLLLTSGDALPGNVAAELQRLQVGDVYVVGGANSVSDAVVAQIEALGATVHRVGGADRYAASRALAADAFGDSGSGLVYVATGANFPDALAAGGAAGHAGAPVLLVNGSATGLDQETKEQLAALGTSQIKIAGGPASVSPGIQADLEAIAPTVRLWGPDRISAAAAINLDAYGSSERAFLVTGYKFPDALSGSAWAGRLGVPLYVSQPGCVPGSVADALSTQGVDALTLIGGRASLLPEVQGFTICPGV
jgi:putative cell wall-binding protein